MVWWNPFTWIKEDPVTRCGWYVLSIYKKPTDDPYFSFCEWDDNATSNGYPYRDQISLEKHIETGLNQLNILQSEYPRHSFEYKLGEFYKEVWPRLVGLFR